jgi:hypothetical protein
VIQISVSYNTIKKNKTLGDFSVKSEEEVPETKELPTLE